MAHRCATRTALRDNGNGALHSASSFTACDPTFYIQLPTNSRHSRGRTGCQSQQPQKATSSQDVGQHSASTVDSDSVRFTVFEGSESREPACKVTCRCAALPLLPFCACCNLVQQRTARARLSNLGVKEPDSAQCKLGMVYCDACIHKIV